MKIVFVARYKLALNKLILDVLTEITAAGSSSMLLTKVDGYGT